MRNIDRSLFYFKDRDDAVYLMYNGWSLLAFCKETGLTYVAGGIYPAYDEDFPFVLRHGQIVVKPEETELETEGPENGALFYEDYDYDE